MPRPSSIGPALLTLALLFASTGCSDDDDGSAATTSAAPPSSTGSSTAGGDGEDDGDGRAEDDGDDDLDCIDASAVESLVGGPVDRDRGSGTSISGGFGTSGVNYVSYHYDSCDYDLVEGGQGQLSVLRVTSAEVGGEPLEGSVFETMRESARTNFVDEGFEPLGELGVEAFRDGHKAVFRSESAMVFVDVEIDEERSVDAAMEVVGALTASPEPIPADDPDCDALAALVSDSFGASTEVRVLGGATSIGDFELQRSGCVSFHTDGYEVSISVADGSKWDAWVEAMRTSSFTSLYTDVEVAGHEAYDDGTELVVGDRANPLIITASGDDLEPDTAGARLRLAELVLEA